MASSPQSAAQQRVIETETGSVRVETVASGLAHPWAIAFLPPTGAARSSPTPSTIGFPAIAPSGMTFYTGDLFSQWRGKVLLGGLVAQAVIRLSLDGHTVTSQERIGLGAPVRDVRQGPDEAVYVITDEASGRILRLTPKPKQD